jgi:Tfp pilus assembly protein PilF
MVGLSTTYQVLDERREATLTAIPVATAIAIEAVYQKGLAYINIERWQEAKNQLDIVFELDPNYKQVQTKLREVESEIAKEPSSVQQPTSTYNAPKNLDRKEGDVKLVKER